jgi:hypothetical protein
LQVSKRNVDRQGRFLQCNGQKIQNNQPIKKTFHDVEGLHPIWAALFLALQQRRCLRIIRSELTDALQALIDIDFFAV